MRAAIYARYSSDLQSTASITDQVRLCRRLAEELGWTVVEVFDDEAISGATHLRPGFQAMQQAAMNGDFDVLVAEALDRLSRDQEHIAGLHKRLTYLGVQIHTKTEGRISEIHIGLGGTMSALFLRQLADKTRRGLEGRIKAGKSAGGLSYGYRLDRQPLPNGTWSTGDRMIDPAQAAIVSRIFTEYARGRSARSIAIGLNRDGIPAPRSGGKSKGTWSFSTISGNWKRGTGILNNELYIGRLVWNRQRFVKNPDTGKRQARQNPEADWVIEDVPHLRIIDEPLWTRVKRRQGAIREDILSTRAVATSTPRIERGHRPRYLLSGLLACGCCGARYIMVSASRYGCSAARNKGTCSNRKTIEREIVEARVLNGLRHKLMHPDLVREFIATFQKEVQSVRRQAMNTRQAHEHELDTVITKIDAIVTAISKGMYHPSLKAKLDGLEAERYDLEARLAAPEPEAIVIHPGLAETYAQKVASLSQSLNDPEVRPEAADALRGMMESVTLIPEAEAPNGHRIELVGELGAILSLCGKQGGTKANARSDATGVRQVTMVAGVGFEPTTFRL